MDENVIQILQKNLTVEFQALAQIHTMANRNLFEQFNNDQSQNNG